MRVSATLLAALLVLLVLAVPAIALEDGIIETSSMTPNDDLTHAVFERVITNTTGDPIEVAARDLRMADYPIMTVSEITAGTFNDGIWTVGTLEGGQTASITYTGDAAPVTTVTTVAASAAPTTTSPSEELPYTGQREHLATLGIIGLALIGLGASLLRVTRD